MRDLYNEFFYIPKHGKIREKVMIARVAALIVRMPEEVGNVANYRGDTVPEVDLGITVKADQIKKN